MKSSWRGGVGSGAAAGRRHAPALPLIPARFRALPARERADLVLLQLFARARGVSDVLKIVRTVLPRRVQHDLTPARMVIHEGRDVVHFTVDDEPEIVVRRVLLHLGERDHARRSGHDEMVRRVAV